MVSHLVYLSLLISSMYVNFNILFHKLSLNFVFILAEGANSDFITLFWKVGEEARHFCCFNEDNLQLHIQMKFQKGYKLSLFTSGEGITSVFPKLSCVLL